MNKKLLTILLSLMIASVSQATIDAVQWDAIEGINLTAAGVLDWATWGDGEPLDGAAGNAATNYKLGGSGITKTLYADWDTTQTFPSAPGYEDTDYTFANASNIWTWSDGAVVASGSHVADGTIDGVGMRGWITPLGNLSVTFDGASSGDFIAKIVLRRDASCEIWADQGAQSVLVNSSAEDGTATVLFSGLDPMTIRALNPSDIAAVRLRGFAATLTPEPATIVLLGIGGLFLRRRK